MTSVDLHGRQRAEEVHLLGARFARRREIHFQNRVISPVPRYQESHNVQLGGSKTQHVTGLIA